MNKIEKGGLLMEMNDWLRRHPIESYPIIQDVIDHNIMLRAKEMLEKTL